MKAATTFAERYLSEQTFQSTPPVKAATLKVALLEPVQTTFQSTPPVKAATDTVCSKTLEAAFQSTPPVKAATYPPSSLCNCYGISIHAAREGGDATGKYRLSAVHGFQSTPPVKAATAVQSECPPWGLFQSTPPVKAATFAFRFKCGHGFNFNPRRP